MGGEGEGEGEGEGGSYRRTELAMIFSKRVRQNTQEVAVVSRHTWSYLCTSCTQPRTVSLLAFLLMSDTTDVDTRWCH